MLHRTLLIFSKGRYGRDRTMAVAATRGFHLEDKRNIWRSKLYYHPTQWKKFYGGIELYGVRRWLEDLCREQSGFYNQGLHPLGTGAFEAELERKGIPVKKYELPTTTAVKRVHEMVVLRRMALQEASNEAITAQREQGKLEAPSSIWYNERDGPLNPNFLRVMASHYKKDITELPSTPIL